MFFFWGIGDDTIVGVTRISLLSADVLYITARVVTSAPALKSFTELPPRAFDTLHWTTFMPHIWLTFTYLLIIYIRPALILALIQLDVFNSTVSSRAY